MTKSAGLSIAILIASMLLGAPSSVVCADTTDTSGVTPTSLSSIKIDRDGNVISESPTTSTTLVNSSTTLSTIKNGSDSPGDNSNDSNSESTSDDQNTASSSTTTTLKRNNKGSSSGSTTNKTTGDGTQAWAPATENADNTDDSNNSATTVTNESDNSNGSNNAGLSDDSNDGSKETVVAGEQVENPELSDKLDIKQEDSPKTNLIGFDIKPYLAMAVLVMLAGTTIFSGKPPTAGTNGAIRNKQYKRSRLS
jgi:hypothetical protein